MRRLSKIGPRLIASLIALTMAGAMPDTNSAAADADPSPDKFTIIRYLNNRGNVTTFEIADALGLLKEKNIKIEAEGYTQGGPESLVALASGAVDIAGAATPAMINAIAGGAKIVCIMPDGGINEDVNSKFYVLENSPVKVPQDLKEKSIAVNTLGAHLDYTIREYLRNNGLDNDDVKLVTVPGPQLEQILRHKQADMVAVGAWQSIFAGKIADVGGVRVMFTDFDVLGDIVLGSDAMKKSFVEQHPQAVKDFVTASASAVDWVAEHPDEARKLFADILQKRGDNPELARFWPGYGLRRHALYNEHDISFWLDVLVRGGRLKAGQLRPDDIATNKYNATTELARQ